MRFVKRVAAVTALLAVAAMPAALAAERATVAVHAGGVDFLPTVGYGSATLTVSGNGITFSRAIGRGGNLSIGLFDPEGQLLADGTYRWELQLVPTEKAAERLRAEAAANNGRAREPWAAQSGSFTVQGGIIADPDLVEPRGSRPAAPPQTSAFTTAGFAAARGPAADDDSAVGARLGVEAQVNAAARRRAPAADGGVLLQADPRAGDDSDATTAALGRSLERLAAPANTQFSAQSLGAPVPRPRSDGSNGRPRS